MSKLTEIEIKRDVSAYADCEEILSLIIDKASEIAGSEVDIDDTSDGYCLTFNVNGEPAYVNIEKSFSLISEIFLSIAVAALDFDLDYDDNDIRLEDWTITVDGKESHYATMESWAATYEEPGEDVIYGEDVDFNEKKCSKWAKSQLEKLSISDIREAFASENFYPCEDVRFSRYDMIKHKPCITIKSVPQEAYAVAKKVVADMNFTDEELKDAASKVKFSWNISDDYDIEEY